MLFYTAESWQKTAKRESGHRLQTVRHVLLECRKFTRLRKETWREEQGEETFDVVEWREILTHPLKAKKAAYFMRKEGLLKLFQGADSIV